MGIAMATTRQNWLAWHPNWSTQPCIDPLKHATVFEDHCLHFVSRLGPWRFCFSEDCKSKIISCVDGKGGE